MNELSRALDPESVSQALDHLPVGLDETYQRIFGAIDARYQENVRHILMLLAFERGMASFNLETLAELYAIRPNDPVAVAKTKQLFPPTIFSK